MGEEDQLEKAYEIERRLAVEEIRHWINALSAEDREKPTMSVGGRTFAPMELLREIEGSTSYGRLFVKRLTNQRFELAKREEKR